MDEIEISGGMVMKSMVLLAILTITACSMGTSKSGAAHPPAEQEGRSSPVAVGEIAPDFTLEDQSGQKVALSSFRGQSPVTLVFYRGYW